MKNNEFPPVTYFKSNEFECACCGVNATDIALVLMLDFSRGLANTPFKINSASRCNIHNIRVRGSSTSSHIFDFAHNNLKFSKAADISNNNSAILKLFEIFKIADNSIQRFKFLKHLTDCFYNVDNSSYEILQKTKELRLIFSLVKQGFTRIGVSKNFVHVDIDNSKDNNVCWVYK